MIQGEAESICIGDDGGQFVGGSFSGVKDFDTGPGLDLRESVGAEDGFVTCFDRSGKYRWTTTFGAGQPIEVRGLAVSHGVLYAVCDERDGHVAVLAMDTTSGAAKPGFGVSGSQMFRCGDLDAAASIRCQDDTIFVPIHCTNFFGSGERTWTSTFAVVLALDRSSGSAVTIFGANGVQTIGNASVTADSAPRFDSLQPIGMAVSRSSIYIVGHCVGSNLEIGRQGAIIAEWQPRAFIAAIDRHSGAAVSGFGQGGVVLMESNISTANDAEVVGDSLYVTGSWEERLRTSAFVAMLNAATGAPIGQFGNAGIKLFGASEWQRGDWQSGWSVRVNGAVSYVAGGYIKVDNQIEERSTQGVFVAAFNRADGSPLTSFGNRGVQLIEGITGEEQGRIEPFGDDLFLIARTHPSLERGKHEVKIGNVIIKKGEMSGFLFRLSRDGAIIGK